MKLKEILGSWLIVMMTLIKRRILKLAQTNIRERVYIVLVHLVDVSNWGIVVRLSIFESLFMICMILFIEIVFTIIKVVFLIFHLVLIQWSLAMRNIYLLALKVILWIHMIWLLNKSLMMDIAAHVWQDWIGIGIHVWILIRRFCLSVIILILIIIIFYKWIWIIWLIWCIIDTILLANTTFTVCLDIILRIKIKFFIDFWILWLNIFVSLVILSILIITYLII